MKQLVLALCSVILIPSLLTGCQRDDQKPELNPVILTSAPHATNLRKYTIPEGMTAYADLPAMEDALTAGDFQLQAVDRVFILGVDPPGLTPSFRAQNGEVMVVYRNIADEERSFIIYQYPTLDPDALLEEQAVFISPKEINGQPFHIINLPNDNPDQEAFAVRDNWLVHFRAIGFSNDEFREALADLTSHSLD